MIRFENFLFLMISFILSFLNKQKLYIIIEYEEENKRLLKRDNSVKLGTYCNPSDNDWQPWSPILFPQKKKLKKI